MTMIINAGRILWWSSLCLPLLPSASCHQRLENRCIVSGTLRTKFHKLGTFYLLFFPPAMFSLELYVPDAYCLHRNTFKTRLWRHRCSWGFNLWHAWPTFFNSCCSLILLDPQSAVAAHHLHVGQVVFRPCAGAAAGWFCCEKLCWFKSGIFIHHHFILYLNSCKKRDVSNGIFLCQATQNSFDQCDQAGQHEIYKYISLSS